MAKGTSNRICIVDGCENKLGCRNKHGFCIEHKSYTEKLWYAEQCRIKEQQELENPKIAETNIVHGKRTNISLVQAWAISLGGELISTVYINMLGKLEWKCSEGHVFSTTFNHVKNREQWCPVCGKEKAHKSLITRMATSEARDKISKGHWRRNGITSNEERLKRNAKKKKEHYLLRLKTDTQERLKHNIRVRIRLAIKGTKNFSISTNMGCTWYTLCNHLESLFQPGMTWENYGRKGWHVDHIKPLSRFDLQDPKQIIDAIHYTNLQPLWAKDNLVKSDKYEEII